MKITTESASQLTATDKNISSLFIGPILGVIGVAIVIASSTISANRTAAMLTGGLFVIIGILILVFRKSTTLTIDKTSDSISLTRKGLTGANTYPAKVSDVVKVQLISEMRTMYESGSSGQQGFSMGRNTSTRQITTLMLLLRDGTTINVAEGNRQMGTMAIVTHTPNQDVGQKIAQFLNVPFEVGGASLPSVGDVVEGVQKLFSHGETPSVAAGQPPTPVAPPPSTTPASPGGPGFAMPHSQQPAAPPPPLEEPPLPPTPPAPPGV